MQLKVYEITWGETLTATGSVAGNVVSYDITFSDQGPVGPVGPVGPAGPAGIQGIQGPVGPAGIQGPAGAGIATLTTKGDTLYRGEVTGERLPIGTTGQILKVSAGGLPEWGAAPASGVSSVNGQTGAVTITPASIDAANDNHTHNSADVYFQGLEILGADNANTNGVYVYGGEYLGKGVYYKDKNTFVYWDGASWMVSYNSDDIYSSAQNTTTPWQVTSWSVESGQTSPGPSSWDRLTGDQWEAVVGQRLNPTLRGDAAGKNVGTGANDVAAGNDSRFTNARQPLSHSSTHHTGGTDAIAPSAIGAAASGAITSSGLTGTGGGRIIGRITDGSGALAEIGVSSPLAFSGGNLGMLSGVIPSAPTVTPSALGVAAIGTATSYARADHVHAMPTAADVGAAPAIHASSHHTGGTDAIAPNQISAAWAEVLSTQVLTQNTLLPSGRNRRITVSSSPQTTFNLDLPFTGNQNGDIISLVTPSNFESQTLIVRRPSRIIGGVPESWTTLFTLNAPNQSCTFTSDGTGSGWSLRAVDTHTHTSTQITGLPSASSATPSALGTAAAGTGTAYSREDHVHSADLSDSAFRVVGSSDATKKVAFEVDGLDTATTRTLTVPNASGTIALTTTAPATHAASHAAAGSDPVTLDVSQVTSANGLGNVWGGGETLEDVFGNAGNAFFSDQSDFAAASHSHGNINSSGRVGSTSGLPLKTGTAGVVEAGAFGTTAGTFAQGNDTRLSDSRTPTAHAASHASGGSDPLAPSDIGAQSLFDASTQIIAANTTLAAARARKYTIQNYDGNTYSVVLPTAGVQSGDIAIVLAGTLVGSQNIRKEIGGGNFTTIATLSDGQSYRFVYTDASWLIDPVYTHTHPASAISDSTTAGRALLTGADNSAQRTSLGLGTAATSATGDFAAASHSHGNINSSGQVGSDAGRVLVTTTAGAVTTLALGAANTVLKVNSGGTAVEFGAAGGVTSGNIDNAVLRADGTGGSASQSSDLIVDDPVVAFACTGDAGTDIITAVGHNFTDNQRIRFQSLTGGAGLFFGGPASSTTYFVRNISGNTFQVSTTSGGSAFNFTTNITAGAVLAVQRNLTLRTRKQAFSMTADAATDVITATGHTFVNGDAVSFYNLTGGNNLDEVSRWYVIEAATNTFKVSNSLNGTARDITTSYTGGTVELEIPLVLGAPRSSALILGEKPDGTLIGGNLRGYGAVDFQTNRNGQNAIASGTFSFIGNGQNNTASGTRAIVLGGTGNTANNTDAVVCGGEANGASGVRSIVCGGSSNNATAQWACIGGGTENSNGGLAAFVSGASNTATGAQSGVLCGRNGRADRDNMFAHATGLFAVGGDAQTVRVSLRNRASTATAVELFMGFSADTRFTIPSGKTMSALINIIAATSGGEFANRYIRAVTIANRGGTTALRGAVKDIDTDEQIGGADVTISANDTNDAIRIEFSGVAPVTGCTTSGSGTAAVINKVAHGYSNNDDIVFTSLTGGAGLTVNTVTYWVINATADTFQVSATRGGTSANISTNYTDMTAARLFRVVAGIDAVEVGHGT